METGARLIGTVKSFTDHWGFVRTDEGKDYFFNERSALNGRQKKENTEEKRGRKFRIEKRQSGGLAATQMFEGPLVVVSTPIALSKRTS